MVRIGLKFSEMVVYIANSYTKGHLTCLTDVFLVSIALSNFDGSLFTR